MKRAVAALLLPSLALCAAAVSSETIVQPAPTKVDDKAALNRLIKNSGMTIQWIDWSGAGRGKLKAGWEGKTLVLAGSQRSKDGSARVSVEGDVRRISKTEFILDGTIIIENTPDMGRQCSKTGEWRFAITQNRKYWRLRDFEWCDQLTDYIDIYF